MTCNTGQINYFNEQIAERRAEMERVASLGLDTSVLDSMESEIQKLTEDRDELIKKDEDFHAMLGNLGLRHVHDDDDEYKLNLG